MCASTNVLERYEELFNVFNDVRQQKVASQDLEKSRDEIISHKDICVLHSFCSSAYHSILYISATS